MLTRFFPKSWKPAMRTTSSANKREFINFDEKCGPILLFSSMFAKSVIKIKKRVGTKRSPVKGKELFGNLIQRSML
jgi:hypothetical protein